MTQRFGGRYELIEEIGAGGMGRVFETLDTETGRIVATKVMIAAGELELQALLRFQQEGAVLATLTHPNIVSVYGTFLEEQTCAIVMELLRGSSLRALLERDRPPLVQTKQIAIQVLSALEYAHTRGIVHRDVKPDNVMVLPDGRVKVTDFGVARVAQAGNSLNTATGATMGTPLYMSPEQIEGIKVDGRSDLYSLGVVLYQMVTDRPPFDGDEPLTIAFKHVHKAPQPPSDLNQTLPPAWETMILRALAKSPSDRFQTAAAMREVLETLPTALVSARGRVLPVTVPVDHSTRTDETAAAEVPEFADGRNRGAGRPPAIASPMSGDRSSASHTSRVPRGLRAANTGSRSAPRRKRRLTTFGGVAAAVALLGAVSAVLVDRMTSPAASLHPVESVAFSPKGKLLASAAEDGTIRLWNVATRKPFGAPLRSPGNTVYSVAFNQNGRVLASGNEDTTVRLWNVPTGKPLGSPLKGHVGYVTSVAFNPKGTLLASGSEDGAIRLWNVATRTPHGSSLTGPTSTVYSVTFSPSGTLLASGSGGSIWLWDVKTRKPLGSPLTGHTDTVYSVAFSPNGKLLASGGNDRTTRLWNVAARTPHGSPFTGPVGYVTSVAFSPDGKLLASGAEDGTIRLWTVATRKPYGAPLPSTNKVSSVAFSPNGKLLAAGGEDGTVRLWNVATRRHQGPPLIGGS